MGRQVKFYWNKTDKRYLEKDIKQQGNTLTDVHFVDDTELVNPVMKLSSFDASQVNYVEIPSLDRFYYVTGVTYSKGYYYVNLHVDVLMSFHDSILQQETILSRCSLENFYNLFQSDDRFQLYEYSNIRYKKFTGGSTFSPNVQNFVLCVMGGDELESEGS